MKVRAKAIPAGEPIEFVLFEEDPSVHPGIWWCGDEKVHGKVLPGHWRLGGEDHGDPFDHGSSRLRTNSWVYRNPATGVLDFVLAEDFDKVWEPVPVTKHCPKCNSERPGHECWKCGATLVVPCGGWDYPVLPPLEPIKAAARLCGYAIAAHGTQQRDLDLVAIPWTESALPHKELVAAICLALTANDQPARVSGDVYEQKPHGRIACCIQMNGWYKLIDLSIMPLAGASAL